MSILRALVLATTMNAVWMAAHAQPAGEVVAMNAPAFLVRDGVTVPLQAGAALQPGDLVRTGADARVLMRFAEGSDIKLGAGAEFAVRAFERRADGVFGGLLDVLRGAFRFTTTLVSGRYRRDLDVRVTTVTAGIRGTDIWGRSNDERDLVCLIDGSISVRHEGGPTVAMNQALTLFVAPRGRQPLPVQPVDRAQLAQWATETELLVGAGISEAGGRFSLHLQSSTERAQAETWLSRLREAGYAASLAEVDLAGVQWNRVSLHDFPSIAEARALGERLAIEFGLRDAWVQRR